MPKIKVDNIVSFSSEDPAFPSSNLLSGDPAKKWKCNTRGENSASVVLQLDRATKITAIDIGNEHSSSIEVLVNRSSNGASEDFKVLLSSSTFMSALESRQSTNINKVRMFPLDQLSQPECDEKWDRMKIVCTQPFNKHVQYGISFITFHSTEVKEQKAAVAVKDLGKFTLRPESPQDLDVGSLFANRNDVTPSSTLTAAAAIRQAANSPLQTKTPLLDKLKRSKEGSVSPSTSKLSNEVEIEESKRKRNRMDILYAKDEEDSNDKIDKLIAKKAEEKERIDAEKKEKEKQEAEKKDKERIAKLDRIKKLQALSEKKTPKLNRIYSDDSSSDSGEKDDANNSPNKRNIKTRDIHNNKRKATDNGKISKKKVKKMKKPFHKLLEGIVITISGIQNPDRADLRSKAVSMGAKYKGDWDSTCTHLICAFVNTPKFLQVRGYGKIVTKHWILDCHGDRKRLPWRRYALDRNDYGTASEDEIFEQDIENSDLEDPEPTSGKVYDYDKVEDKNLPSTSNDNVKTGLPQLPNFFTSKEFYVDDSLGDVDKQLLRKYVIAYNGTILDDVNDASVVLTSIENVINLKSICPDNVEFVSTDWIWECHNKQRCVSPTDFLMM